MSETTSVASFRSFLVASSAMPDLTGLDPASVTLLTAAPGKPLNGAAIRKAAAATAADFVAVVRPGAQLRPGWLERAAELLDDVGTAAVSFLAEDVPPRICYDAAATVFEAEALREIGGFLKAFDAEGFEADAVWRIALRGHATPAEAGWVTTRPAGTLSIPTRMALLASNAETETFQKVAPALLLAIWNDPLAASGADTTALDLQRSPGGDETATLTLPGGALDGTARMRAFADWIEPLRTARPVAQATRRLSDRMVGKEISGFVDDTWQAIGGDRSRLESAFFGAIDSAPVPRVAIFGRIPEPGSWVDLLHEQSGGSIEIRAVDVGSGSVFRYLDGAWVAKGAMGKLSKWTEVAVLDGVHIRRIPWLASSEVPVLLNAVGWDLEADLLSEFPSMAAGTASKGAAADLLIETAARVDHVITGNEDQCDRFLGVLAGLGRVNTLVYDEDNSLLNLVELRSDPAAAVAEFCANPRRSADLVHSFDRSAEARGSGRGPRALAARLLRARA